MGWYRYTSHWENHSTQCENLSVFLFIRQAAALSVKKLGIDIVSLGIGRIDQEELLGASSHPPDDNTILVGDFNQLDNVIGKVTRRICDGKLYRPLGYERAYLPLCKDTPFYIQGDNIARSENILT